MALLVEILILIGAISLGTLPGTAYRKRRRHQD